MVHGACHGVLSFFKFHIPETRGRRISATAKIFPTHYKVPGISTTDVSVAAANNLISALQHPSLSLPDLRLDTNHTSALKQFADICNNTTKTQQSKIISNLLPDKESALPNTTNTISKYQNN